MKGGFNKKTLFNEEVLYKCNDWSLFKSDNKKVVICRLISDSDLQMIFTAD